MATVSLLQSDSLTNKWVCCKSGPQSPVHRLGDKIGSLGASLRSLAEAVGRISIGCIAFLGYLMTLGYWQQAKDFGMQQMQKGIYAGSVNFSRVHPAVSPREQVQPPVISPAVPPLVGPQVAVPLAAATRGQETEQIEKKLRYQFERAQNQADQERDKPFEYLLAPKDFEGQVQTERAANYEVGVCHFIGQRISMEDEYLTTSFHLNVGGRDYPVQLFGIFDGHGGQEASLYVKRNLESKLHAALNELCSGGLTDAAIWNALKITFVRLAEEFANDNKPMVGTTATVAMILDGKLWTANIGDSRTILDNGIQLSEDAKPSDDYFRKGIEKRGGWVFRNRVNGILGVARAIGDIDTIGVNPRPKITVLHLADLPVECHLILACDGIYDVASTRQIAAAVRDHKELPPAELAKNIVHSAYEAFSTDNLSVLIVKL